MAKSNTIKVFAVLATLLLTAGCSTVALLQDRNVSRLSEPGVKQPEVTAMLGKPVAVLDTMNGQGVCNDYLYTPPKGAETRIWVHFRKSDDMLVAFSMNITCEEAGKAGHLNNLVPYAERKK